MDSTLERTVMVMRGKYKNWAGGVISEYNGIKKLGSREKWYTVVIYNDGEKLRLPRSSFKIIGLPN